MECKVLGISVVKVKVFDVILKTLGNAKHVPELGGSPISFKVDSIIWVMDIFIFCMSGFMKINKRVLVLIWYILFCNFFKKIILKIKLEF